MLKDAVLSWLLATRIPGDARLLWLQPVGRDRALLFAVSCNSVLNFIIKS